MHALTLKQVGPRNVLYQHKNMFRAYKCNLPTQILVAFCTEKKHVPELARVYQPRMILLGHTFLR